MAWGNTTPRLTSRFISSIRRQCEPGSRSSASMCAIHEEEAVRYVFGDYTLGTDRRELSHTEVSTNRRSRWRRWSGG
jgi:hypothetical protein